MTFNHYDGFNRDVVIDLEEMSERIDLAATDLEEIAVATGNQLAHAPSRGGTQVASNRGGGGAGGGRRGGRGR